MVLKESFLERVEDVNCCFLIISQQFFLSNIMISLSFSPSGLNMGERYLLLIVVGRQFLTKYSYSTHIFLSSSFSDFCISEVWWMWYYNSWLGGGWLKLCKKTLISQVMLQYSLLVSRRLEFHHHMSGE